MEFSEERIIILEDSETDLLILEKMLLELGFKANNIKVASELAALDYSGQHFVLCDLNLPDSTGRDTLKSVLNQTNPTTSSVIVMTGMSDEQLAQEAIQLGAQDYLIKGTFSLGVLRKTLTFAYERNRLVSRLDRNQQELIEVQKYLETILETAPGVIIKFRKDLIIEYVSRSIKGIISVEQMLGKSLLSFAPETEAKEIRYLLGELTRTGHSQYFEGSMISESDKEYHFLYRTSAVGDGTYILIATDITELIDSRDELEMEKIKSQETQLQLLSAQLNPHFIFNALSSIQHSILHNELEISLNFLSAFASLMRQVLENSRKRLVSWKEEKEFLANYLKIESFRFDDSFDQVFEDDQALEEDYIMVPPMLVQPYLENTVVHGLANLTSRKGEVVISTKQCEKRICISIKDNGVGREEAISKRGLRVGTNHVSRALSINEQRLNLLNSVYDTSDFEVKIHDLKDEKDNAAGTEVVVYIPFELQDY